MTEEKKSREGSSTIRAANVAVSVNVGRSGGTRVVQRKQVVTSQDGKTTVTTDEEEWHGRARGESTAR